MPTAFMQDKFHCFVIPRCIACLARGIEVDGTKIAIAKFTTIKYLHGTFLASTKVLLLQSTTVLVTFLPRSHRKNIETTTRRHLKPSFD